MTEAICFCGHLKSDHTENGFCKLCGCGGFDKLTPISEHLAKWSKEYERQKECWRYTRA